MAELDLEIKLGVHVEVPAFVSRHVRSMLVTNILDIPYPSLSALPSMVSCSMIASHREHDDVLRIVNHGKSPQCNIITFAQLFLCILRFAYIWGCRVCLLDGSVPQKPYLKIS